MMIDKVGAVDLGFAEILGWRREKERVCVKKTGQRGGGGLVNIILHFAPYIIVKLLVRLKV